MLKFSVLVVLAIFIATNWAVKVADDLTLTSSEKKTLDKFKDRVLPKLDKDYQKTDIYLIRWLRAKNFNIQQAEELLKQDIQWRAKEKMDTIRNEDWSAFEVEYPYFVDGFDNEGKPTNFGGEWDLRRGTVAGKSDKIKRWMVKMFDDAVYKIRQLQEERKNVTQFDFIINMDNFNLPQHGCLQCLPIYVAFVANYENHFPGAADKIILINTPGIFEIVLNLIRPIMSKRTKEALKVYGNNKAEWEDLLFEDIDRSQLPTSYGGTKEL